MPDLADDFRQQLCPQCGEKGIYRDPSNGLLRCKYCKASGFRINPPKQTPAGILPQQPVPAIPPNTPAIDIVDDYFIDSKGNRHKISSVYAPKARPTPPVEAFDPNGFWVKVAQKRFAEQIKQRKRLNRDIIRRARGQGKETVEWSEQWARERGALPITTADRIINEVRQSVRRQRRKEKNEFRASNS